MPQDYGRTIYDLAIRRALIQIGEDMVNVAYEAPVDRDPAETDRGSRAQLYELAESGRYMEASSASTQALTAAVDMAAKGLSARRQDVRAGHRPTRTRPKMGGLQPSDLIILAGRPGMGKTALATNIAYNVAKAWRGEGGRRHIADHRWWNRRFFSLEMSAEQLATRILAEQTGIPSNKIRRGRSKSRIRERSKTSRSNCRACRFASTRPVAFRSGNWRRARRRLSGSAGSISW